MTPHHTPRRGATLVELLVVITIMVALLSLALMVVPNINQTNAVQKAAGEVQSAFKTAQAQASATRLPRGVRFLVNNGYVATELQYLEMPPVIVSDPQALTAVPTDPNGANTPYGPRVEFSYVLAGAPAMGATNPPPVNAVTNRHCYVRGLTTDQAAQVVPGATLVLPVLGAWARITSASWVQPSAPLTSSAPAPGPYTYTSTHTNAPAVDLEAVLDVYPDALLGTATSYRTFHFGIYGAPVPLLAEPTVLLPTGIAADLQISYPALQTQLQNYDVMFSPNGPTVGTGNVAANTNVYIWIRDITKTTNPSGTAPTSMYLGNFPTVATYIAAFPIEGDQVIVGVRAGGFIGTAPVNWPSVPTSTTGYPSGQDAFTLARQQLNK
jgi:type II secretory pathway pseudopilin PulG